MNIIHTIRIDKDNSFCILFISDFQLTIFIYYEIHIKLYYNILCLTYWCLENLFIVILKIIITITPGVTIKYESKKNREVWKKSVNEIKGEARATTKPTKKTVPATTHQLQSQRFTFFPAKRKAKPAKQPKKLSDNAARDGFYKRLNAPALSHAKVEAFFEP